MVDVSLAEDLIFGLSNLVAIESHAKSSFYKTNDMKWLELNAIAREIRSRWLELIYKPGDDELWCLDKHLLASIMALQEVANRFATQGKKELMKQAEKDASDLYGLFLILNDLKEGKK